MHHPDVLGAEILQHLRDRLDPLAREQADHLAFDAGRIRERTEQVEDGAGAELDAGRADVLHGRMMGGREHEPDARLADATPDAVGGNLDVDAERGQHVGGARARGERAVAVLGDRHPGAGHDEGRTGRDIEGARRIAACAATRSIFSRITVTAPVISSTVSPRTRNAINRAPICEGVASPDIMVSKPRAASSRVSVAPVAALAINPLNSSVTFAPHSTRRAARLSTGRRPLDAFQAAAMSRKLRKIRWPCSEAMLSGWNCTPCAGSMRWASPMTRSPVSAVTVRSDGNVVRPTTSE